MENKKSTLQFKKMVIEDPTHEKICKIQDILSELGFSYREITNKSPRFLYIYRDHYELGYLEFEFKNEECLSTITIDEFMNIVNPKPTRKQVMDSIKFTKTFIGYNKEEIIKKLTALGLTNKGEDNEWNSHLFLMIDDGFFYPAGEVHFIESPYVKITPEELLKLEWQEDFIPFDIEKARAGDKVVTRDGHPVRIVCWDVNDSLNRSLIGLIEDPYGWEHPYLFTEEGLCNDNKHDLVILKNQ